MTAGQIIRMLRTTGQVRWSQAELASEMGVVRTYLSSIETGRRQPGLQFLRKAARVLRVPVALLLVGEREWNVEAARTAELFTTVNQLEDAEAFRRHLSHKNWNLVAVEIDV